MNVLYIFLGVVAVIILIIIMVFLIARSKGKIIIQPESYNYSAGDPIKGKIILQLKKPIEANSLKIRLFGVRTNKSYSTGQSKTTHSNTTTIFDFAQPVDGQKLYPLGESSYDFSIKTPKNILTNVDGIAGTIVKSAMLLSGQNSYVQWYLEAVLDAKGINVSKRIQINVA